MNKLYWQRWLMLGLGCFLAAFVVNIVVQQWWLNLSFMNAAGRALVVAAGFAAIYVVAFAFTLRVLHRFRRR